MGLIPISTKLQLEQYINNRVPPGGFLQAVLENNLKESFKRADNSNREALFDIVHFLYNDAPMICWGSPEKVASWLNPEKDVSQNRELDLVDLTESDL